MAQAEITGSINNQVTTIYVIMRTYKEDVRRGEIKAIDAVPKVVEAYVSHEMATTRIGYLNAWFKRQDLPDEYVMQRVDAYNF